MKTTTQATDCTDCNGHGAYGYEDAPGCYSYEGLCRSCKGEGTVVEEVESCDGCKKPTSPDLLQAYGPDACPQWFCRPCMQVAMKTIALSESPAFVEPRGGFHGDFKSTAEMPAVTNEQLMAALKTSARVEAPASRKTSPGSDLKRTMEDKAFDVNQFMLAVAS